MTDLEDRIRATLDARAGVTGIRTMPPGTRRRIRSRQVGASFVALATAAAFSFLILDLFSTPPAGPRPAEGKSDVQIVPAPSESDGSGDWKLVDPPAPGEWPHVTRGDLSEAYIDRTAGEGAFVVDKTPIDGGRVQEEPWSLVALEQNGDGAMWYEAAPGPCGELFLNSTGDYGGASVCLRLDDMEGSPEMTSMGIVWGVGPITAYAGVVTSRVDHVEFVVGQNETRRVPLVDGPPGVTGRYFVVFPPNEARGSLVAFGSSGQVVGREPLCAAHLDIPSNAAGGCGNGLLSTSSPVVVGP